MVKVKNGTINGKRVCHGDALLRPNTLGGYWADEEGNRIDKIAFGSVVRFYLGKWWAYNPKLKISIKSSDAEEVIAEEAIKDLKLLCLDPYIEFTLKKRQEYTSLQKARNLELCCGVPRGVWMFEPQEEVAKIKVYEKVVIVIDPGHGDRHSDNKQIDPGACDGTNYEKDFALKLGLSLKKALLNNGYATFMTREDDIDVRPKKRVQWRYDFANGKEAQIFLSFHLDSGSKDAVYTVYESNTKNEALSIILGQKLIQHLSGIVTVSTDRVRDAASYTAVKSVGILRKFNGKAGILFEFGGIASAENLNNITTNSENIAQAITNGIIEFCDENL